MLPPDCAPSSIPEDTEEVLVETEEHEHFPTVLVYSCRVGGEVVGNRRRYTDGRLIREMGWRNDRSNGWDREWDSDGQLCFESFRIDNTEHGVCRQWHEGRLIGWYVMDHGTGLDLWRDHDGSLQEERCLRGQGQHGFERWWETPGNFRIWWERHFHQNLEHGIERKWLRGDRLSRGYPRYFVQGQQVTKRQYLSAAKKDPTLPPFREEDNRPERPLPPEYFETMPPAIPPRFDPETGTIER
jgi:hypothetical protein